MEFVKTDAIKEIEEGVIKRATNGKKMMGYFIEVFDKMEVTPENETVALYTVKLLTQFVVSRGDINKEFSVVALQVALDTLSSFRDETRDKEVANLCRVFGEECQAIQNIIQLSDMGASWVFDIMQGYLAGQRLTHNSTIQRR